ncbi:porphobilinogen deaminase [Sodiomyces alkalinus F11]|uniref:Porphobilinogen deaminase n=1 Tax=Sodiomyces alkalinus (strain CBS 110278 / VKM F-3762 / F11) TaxID=1314773 RepID=A0A3N2PWU5_SODAK|nr:porphobilinogen deaminase [Sodiomyces alkalinus F11]ROT38991.1 porphobilinogen deaminase [Sodiomyces alkalinus F11]
MATPPAPAVGVPSSAPTIRIGTRKSNLAMKQTHIVLEGLKRIRPDYNYEIHSMATLGDKDQNTALYNFGGKGLWTNELEAKLTNKQLDVIVHSLKDMPTVLPQGCVLGAVTNREDPRDVIIFKAGTESQYKTIADLPAGSVIGTSSVRRMAQLRRKYPGLEYADTRGNLETRLRKLDDPEGPYAAIILAAAGLLRMGYDARIGQYLASDQGGILHAVGQGALGIEARADDDRVLSLLAGLEDRSTRLAVEAERSLMRTLEGGCSVPIGVETSWHDEGGAKLKFKATVAHPNGTEAVDGERWAAVDTPEAAERLGKELAQELVEKGAQRILDEINKARAEHQAAAPEAASVST